MNRSKKKALRGKIVLVTAGPTREYIDPVRFISNASSGKMGYALARQARLLGARVILVTGPTSIAYPHGVTVKPVTTAREMKEAVDRVFARVDYVIAAAAVGDFKPARVRKRKIKKSSKITTLRLVPNPDILAQLGRKKTSQKLIGFALETHNVLRSALEKYRKKNLDLIFANTAENIGSAHALFFAVGRGITVLKTAPKGAIARRMWDIILSLDNPSH